MGKAVRCGVGFFLLLMSVAAMDNVAVAQEDVYRLEHRDVFGSLRRPPIEFGHELHVAALEEEGCGACHHGPDEETGRLVYIEGEEVGCSECHGDEADDDTPALREAFHGSCNACHRRMIKSAEDFKGPTTCGECHRPQSDR